VLLANAYNDLPTTDVYSMQIDELTDTLGFDSKNIDYIKNSLRALSRVEVEWDILWKDKKIDWWVMNLLVEPRIQGNTIYYSFWPQLRERLYSPEMYINIKLTMQNKFDSKYTLVFYELCVDYLDKKRKEWETPFMNIVTFRSLLWLWEDEYIEFKNLNRDIIKRATKEINEKTDLYIEFAFKKIGRSISDIKIYIKLKKDTNIIKEKIEDDLHIKYFTLLQNTFLLSPNQAEKVIDKYQDVNNLDKILEWIEKKYKTWTIKNMWAYTFNILMEHSGIIKSEIDLDIEKDKRKSDNKEDEERNNTNTRKKEFRDWFNSLTLDKQDSLMTQYKVGSTLQDKDLLIKSRIASDYIKWNIK